MVGVKDRNEDVAEEPWLEAGNHTCPATMQTLASLELVPNHTLRRLIQN